MKKWLSLLLFVLFMFTCTACSSSGDDGTDVDTGDMSAEELLQASVTKMENVNSLDASILMDIAMTSSGETLTATTTTETTTFAQPFKMRLEMTMDMVAAGQSSSVTSTMYMEEGEDGYLLYIGDGTEWNRQTVEMEAMEQYDSINAASLYLESMTEMEITGTEEVNGEEAYKIEGIIDADGLDEVLTNSGALSSLGDFEGMEETFTDLYKDLGNLPITVWVSTGATYPLRYQMDMSEVLQNLMNNLRASLSAEDTELASSLNFTIETYTVDATMSNFDAAGNFEIPDEAKGE